MAFRLIEHAKLERNVALLGLFALVTVAIGGLVQITPLFWIDSTIEKVDGMRPYTPLEQAGRNIYMREGCYVCHSQMVRPFRDEVERYGPYSLAAESMYDHPFQWGSKRTGPDLARVGGRYSDEWHREHLKDPRAVVPESVMPPYAFLAEHDLNDRPHSGHRRPHAHTHEAAFSYRRIQHPLRPKEIDDARRELERATVPSDVLAQ